MFSAVAGEARCTSKCTYTVRSISTYCADWPLLIFYGLAGEFHILLGCFIYKYAQYLLRSPFVLCVKYYSAK